jgi:hypothetical protein
VPEFELKPALPGFDLIVARMRSEGVEAIANSIDGTGNQNLCTSMDRSGYEVKMHLLTVAGWTNSVGSEFSSPCRTNLYAFGWSLSTSVTSNAEACIPAIVATLLKEPLRWVARSTAMKAGSGSLICSMREGRSGLRLMQPAFTQLPRTRGSGRPGSRCGRALDVAGLAEGVHGGGEG